MRRDCATSVAVEEGPRRRRLRRDLGQLRRIQRRRDTGRRSAARDPGKRADLSDYDGCTKKRYHRGCAIQDVRLNQAEAEKKTQRTLEENNIQYLKPLLTPRFADSSGR